MMAILLFAAVLPFAGAMSILFYDGVQGEDGEVKAGSKMDRHQKVFWVIVLLGLAAALAYFGLQFGGVVEC